MEVPVHVYAILQFVSSVPLLSKPFLLKANKNEMQVAQKA